MAKAQRRGMLGCHHNDKPKESTLTIVVPATVNNSEVRIAMAADDGELVLNLGEKRFMRINGCELHTALHALGFVRLNDRCGQG